MPRQPGMLRAQCPRREMRLRAGGARSTCARQDGEPAECASTFPIPARHAVPVADGAARRAFGTGDFQQLKVSYILFGTRRETVTYTAQWEREERKQKAPL